MVDFLFMRLIKAFHLIFPSINLGNPRRSSKSRNFLDMVENFDHSTISVR